MQKLKQSLWLGLVAICLFSLAGCGKSQLERDIVGTWKTYDEELEVTHIEAYREDGTIIFKTGLVDLEGQWTVEDKGKGYIRHSAKGADKDTGTVYEIKVDGDTMTSRDIDTNIIQTYTRVPDSTDGDDADAEDSKRAAQKEAESQEAEAAAEGKVTQRAIDNATEAEKKYMTMFTEVIGHLKTFHDVVQEASLRPVAGQTAKIREEYEAARKLHLSNFDTPPRFHDTDSKLRLTLMKYDTAMANFSRTSEVGSLDEASQALSETLTAYGTQMTALYNGQ